MRLRENIKPYIVEIPTFLTMMFYSFFLMSLSPILLDISLATGFNIDNLNLVFSFFVFGGIAGMLTSSMWNRLFYRKYIIICGYSLIIVLMLFPSFSKIIAFFYISYFLAGYLTGVVWVQALEQLLAGNNPNKEMLMTFSLSFYPLGAVVSPAISSFIISKGLDWRTIYAVSAIFILLIIISFIFTGRKKTYFAEQKNKSNESPVNFKNKIFIVVFILTAFVLFTYMAAQTVIVSWAPTYFRVLRGFDIYSASVIVSVFFIANFMGRATISFLIKKIDPELMLIAISFLCLLSTAFIVFINNKISVYVFLFLMGLSASGIIPLSVISISKKSRFIRQGVMIAILFASGDIGAMLAPYVIKLVYEKSLKFTIFTALVFITVNFFTVLIRYYFLKKPEKYIC
ncbi:MAG: MFS transporter [Actinobacteria bacterium]|nr:MFS transporter [Actinomycetota bacterium]